MAARLEERASLLRVLAHEARLRGDAEAAARFTRHARTAQAQAEECWPVSTAAG